MIPSSPVPMTPQEAQDLLTALPTDSRRLLAQLVTLHLCISHASNYMWPILSFTPDLAAIAHPLLDAGLVVTDLGVLEVDPNDGLMHIWLSADAPRLFSLVGALLADMTWDGAEAVLYTTRHGGAWRVFPFVAGNEAGGAGDDQTDH